MTGFGKSVVATSTKKITVELKSLNSKQLDITVRAPGAYRSVEIDVRNHIAARLERGKVEVAVYAESAVPDTLATLNIELLRNYKAQVEAMREALGLPEPADWYQTLLHFPDIYRNDAAPEVNDQEKEALLRCTDEAVDQLMAFRRQEGLKLEEFFAERIRRISDLLDQVPRYEQERVTKIRTRITDQLCKIPQVEYDRGRLEQEMIFYIEKLDINEEKQRLANHLSYFIETMNGRHGQGKKLGFISQEMGREINTLGSKSNQAEMQRLVVKMKDELEQIKEQVLNAM